jgi:hypothetical protein
MALPDEKLVSGAECVRRMRQAHVFNGGESYFSQLAKSGAIPWHEKPGSKRRWYYVSEVTEAIKGIEDPARDPQRQANARRRTERGNDAARTREETERLLEWIERYASTMEPEHFDLGEGEINQEEFAKELEEINAQNAILREFAQDFAADAERLYPGAGVRGGILELIVVSVITRWIMTPRNVLESYGIDPAGKTNDDKEV